MPATAMDRSFLFIGAGQMGTALIIGFINAGLVSAAQITVCDHNENRRRYLKEKFPEIERLANLEEFIPECQHPLNVFICVKPDGFITAVEPFQMFNKVTESVFVSIVAGITLQTMHYHIPAGSRIRVMPNTPCLVQSGASGVACHSKTRSEDIDLVMKLMSSVGRAVLMDESKMDAVTGLSGSGPAYVFTFIDALADGGVACGLTRESALLLSAQTVMGAAKMVLETGRHPGQLKDSVASPAGTTIAGLMSLEESAFRSAASKAVVAATNRARELSAIR